MHFRLNIFKVPFLLLEAPNILFPNAECDDDSDPITMMMMVGHTHSSHCGTMTFYLGICNSSTFSEAESVIDQRRNLDSESENYRCVAHANVLATGIGVGANASDKYFYNSLRNIYYLLINKSQRTILFNYIKISLRILKKKQLGQARS